MSVEKQTISIYQNEDGHKKMTHIYHVISRVHDELNNVSSAIFKDSTKYDLIARNTEEALLLFTFREKQQQRMEQKIKKMRKLIQKIN